MKKIIFLSILLSFVFACKKYETQRAEFNPPEWTKGKWEAKNGRVFLIDRGEFVDSEVGSGNQINGSIEFLEERKRKAFQLTFKDQRIYRFRKSGFSSEIILEFQNLAGPLPPSLDDPISLIRKN
jgi:hypothetical protein